MPGEIKKIYNASHQRRAEAASDCMRLLAAFVNLATMSNFYD
jgi:hypothetical protein